MVARMRIDLHTHTSASDGLLSPTELVRQAKEVGLDVIAVTDHDTVEGLDEAEGEASRLGLRLIPGIELSVFGLGREIHLLGYFLDRTSVTLLDFLQEQKESRVRRIFTMLEKLKGMGVVIPPEEVIQVGKKGTMGRPHVARALVRHGHIQAEEHAFQKYIGQDQPAYVPRVKVSAPEGVRMVKEAGGVPVIAHPGLYAKDGVLEHMVEAGVVGIEAYHPDHTDAAAQRFEEQAKERGMLVTGGSDYHGRSRGRRFGLGATWVPESVLDPLEAARP